MQRLQRARLSSTGYGRGLPRSKITKMLWNVAIEAALGAFPLLDDLLDVVWKANLRNIAILTSISGWSSRR